MTVFVLPMMHPVTYELSDHFAVGANIEQTWQFFSTATNLPLITPPWLNFTIDMPDGVEIRKDTLLHYRIRAMGMVMKWESKILEWEPPRRFVDLQTRGPYKLWWHEHRFEPDPLTGGVVCYDRVIYQLPLGPIGRLVHAIKVRRQLVEIFQHRRRVIGEHLGGIRSASSGPTIRSTDFKASDFESV